MSEQQLVELARQHGLRVDDCGAMWGHVRALASLARALLHAEREACAREIDNLQLPNGEFLENPVVVIRARGRA